SDRFSLGLLTSSGSLGLLFPPSLPLILYALVAKVSVDKLFIAGVLPGILRILLITGYSINKGVAFKVVKTAFSFRKLFNSLREAAWEIPLPFIIIGGIYGGIFTATEAAAVTAFYVLIVEVFIYRDLKLFRDIPAVIVKSMMLVGGILIILGTSLGFTGYLIDQQIPMQVLDFVKAAVESKFTFLIILNIFLLITGCVVDIFSAIIIVVPLITPIALNFGVDPVHLGIIFLTNLEIGYITPPVGLNLFISSFRFEKPVLKLYTSTLPFLLLMLLGLIIITYFPDLSLVLVRIWEGR
ncbi:MAG: TRAP transporter large permease subunit, partial [Fidelibacterota bacterium]